jgi:hypothetical protein
MFAPAPGNSSFAHMPYGATAPYAQRPSSRLEDLERMVAVQQQEAARLQSLIERERASLAHQQRVQMQIQMQQQQQYMQQQQYTQQQQYMQQQQRLYYPIPQATPYSPIHPYSVPHPLPHYTQASPFAAHGHPVNQTALPQYHPVDTWNRYAHYDSERRDAHGDPVRNHVRSLSSERRRAAEMEVTDRPRRSSSRSRALSPPTNASRFEAELSSASRRSTGGFSTRSSSAPRSPSRPRSLSRSKKPGEDGGCTVDPESEESKKSRERRKKQNIIELEAAKQERKSEVAERKKQALNSEMTEYFRSKALKTPEVAYSRRFDSIKDWKQTYLEAKAEAGAQEQRAKSPPPPQVVTDTETSYTGTATEELERLFNAPRRTLSPARSSNALASDSAYDRLRRSQSLIQGLAPEDAARSLSRSGNARGSFERFDDVSEQSSLVDADRSTKGSGRANSRVTSPARAFSERQSAPLVASSERRVASPVSPTPQQQHTRVRNRLQGEDTSGLQTRDLFANMSVASEYDDDDDVSDAMRFPPPPRSLHNRQQPQRNLSDYTPSPSKLQQYLDAAKLQVPRLLCLSESQFTNAFFLQSPMHPSYGAKAATPPTLHRYATLV